MRKRSKYRPIARLADPLGFVIERLTPVTTHESTWLVDLKLRNHNAIGTLMRGEGTRPHLTDVVAMYNMTRQLALDGFGKEYGQIVKDAEKALIDMTTRCKGMGRYVLTGPEINALKGLLELHDEQMEVTLVGDIEDAIKRARNNIRCTEHTRLEAPVQPADAGVHRPIEGVA